MERVLSDEEKFRKAEEIYNRRRNINVTVPARELNRNKEKKDKKHYRKMLIQIGISICIYFSVYFIQYSNYYFSNDVIKRVETILSYDINFSETFKTVGEYIKNNKFFSGVLFFLDNDESNKNSMLEDHKGALNTIENSVNENGEINNNQIAGIGNENGSQQLDIDTEGTENTGGIGTEENLGIGGRRRDSYSE